jgi:nondiscriminating aspartyl-tRNA synthetase
MQPTKETKIRRNRILTTELADHIGEQVRLEGWMHRFRQQSRVSFLVLRDGAGLAQIVVEDEALIEHLSQLHNESVLAVTGTVVAEPQAPGGLEVRTPQVELISPSEPPPIDIFRPELKALLPTILDHAALTLRHPTYRAIFQLASASMEGFRAALRARRFVEIQTPKIVGSATESGANVFTIDYFGRPAYLAQSPQFYKQIMVGVFERVFEVGPVFRAEPHDTPRHLNEYVSLDAEMGFIQDHTTVMQVLTEVVREMAQAVSREQSTLSLLKVELPIVPEVIPVIHFAEAQELYSRATGENIVGEPDLAPAHEQWLGEWAQREFASDFLFVWGYPMVKRPFYTHPQPDRPEYSNSFDLLFRGLELVTGGQRLHRYEDYLRAIAHNGLNPEPLTNYLEAFKYGMPPHGGFALGLERWIARLTGRHNIRETTLFPRDRQRIEP